MYFCFNKVDVHIKSCTHVHIKSWCTFLAILFNEWHFSKYIFVFPKIFRFPAIIIASAIDFFNVFFILLRFKCKLHFKIADLSHLNWFPTLDYEILWDLAIVARASSCNWSDDHCSRFNHHGYCQSETKITCREKLFWWFCGEGEATACAWAWLKFVGGDGGGSGRMVKRKHRWHDAPQIEISRAVNWALSRPLAHIHLSIYCLWIESDNAH